MGLQSRASTASQIRRFRRRRCSPNVLLSVLALFVSLLIPSIASATPVEFPNGGRADLAPDGTITGTCQLVDGLYAHGRYTGTAVMPDGGRLPAVCYERYADVPNYENYPGPCDGTYGFQATRKGDGYFVLIFSQNAAAPAPGIAWTKPPAGYTYQRTCAENWTPNILTDVTLHKVSGDETVTGNNSEYSLAGAVYDIFEAGSDRHIGSVTTDDQGMATCKLTVGASYYAVEKTAPEGYALSSERVAFTAGPGASVTLSDKPVQVEVTVQKADSYTGGAAQPGLSLEGAEYRLVDARGVSHLATTDAQGKARFDLIPLGPFSIVETKAPEGYKLDSSVHSYQVDSSAAHTDGVVTFTPEQPLYETPIAFDLELAKFKEDPNADEGGTRWPAEGVQFQIVSGTTGEVVTTLTTDVYGFARTPKDAWYGTGERPKDGRGSLPYDRKGYVVREVASTVPAGYERMDDFTISPDQQLDGVCLKYIIENKTPDTRLQITKTDGASGQTVALAGFSFRLLDAAGKPVTQEAWYPNHVSLDVFTTDTSGCVTLPEQLVPGTYFIEETSTMPPYVLNKKRLKVDLGKGSGPLAVVRFDNKQATGTLEVTKREADSDVALKGAVFDIVAQELIASPDGTVQAVEGEVVATIRTDDEGVARAENLPLGTGTATYACVETEAPDGYVLDPTPHLFTVSYEDAEAQVVTRELELSNEPVEVEVHKVEVGSGDALKGVSFELARDGQDGNEGQAQKDRGKKEGTDVQEAVTNRHGVARWSHLSPGSYHIRETKALDGYVLNPNTYQFTVLETGEVRGDGFADGAVRIDNDYIKVDIAKLDTDTEKPLAGAHLALVDSTGKEIDSWVST